MLLDFGVILLITKALGLSTKGRIMQHIKDILPNTILGKSYFEWVKKQRKNGG